MKIQPECVPCLLKRVLFEAELSTTDKKRQSQALHAACTILSESYDSTQCSATLATKVHKAVYETLNDTDPYRSLKAASTTVALSLVPKVESLIAKSQDPLRTSMICAIIANVLDFGIDGSGIHPRMLEGMFDELYAEGLGHDEYPKLKRKLRHANHVVLCTDNCGEIVFDRILCRELKRFNPRLHITALVKGEPVLSDATKVDADVIRFSDVVDDMVTTGCFCVGVDFTRLPLKAKAALSQADLILSKGMANYESFSEASYRPIAYLLRIKCGAIAHAMKLPRDISVIAIDE